MRSFNKIGVVIAILFGIILLFVSAKENTTYEIDQKSIDKIVLLKSDKVKPGNLNEWILEKNQNYILIDIRTEKEFDEESIPTAENIPAKELFKKDVVSDLPKDKPVIIYSNGDSEIYQGWAILKKAGLKVYILDGGYNYWKKYPSIPENVSEKGLLTYKKDLAAANSLKGVQSADMTGTDIKIVKKKRSKKKKKKKKNKLEGC